VAPAARFDAVARTAPTDLADCAQALQLADDEFSFLVGVGVGRVGNLEGEPGERKAGVARAGADP
jgi:hypothetical protein